MRYLMEAKVGHYLRVRPSLIDHHEAGDGVFVSCRRQGIVLPGTLLGLFAGVVCDPVVPEPSIPEHSAMRPYLKRYDGYWIDYEKELPYPMPSPGTNFEDFVNDFELQAQLRGLNEARLTQVPCDMINPYAVGHKINHPPPDTPTNVKLIDFDLPYSFFPTSFARYIPYINFRDEPKTAK